MYQRRNLLWYGANQVNRHILTHCSSQLRSSPFYQELEYEKLVKNRIAAFKNANWRQDLKTIYLTRKEIWAQLAQATTDHEASGFLDFLDSSLRGTIFSNFRS